MNQVEERALYGHVLQTRQLVKFLTFSDNRQFAVTQFRSFSFGMTAALLKPPHPFTELCPSHHQTENRQQLELVVIIPQFTPPSQVFCVKRHSSQGVKFNRPMIDPPPCFDDVVQREITARTDMSLCDVPYVRLAFRSEHITMRACSREREDEGTFRLEVDEHPV